MVDRVKYQGNPVHKLHPCNFGLKPPGYPDGDYVKCDLHGDIHSKEDALDLLKAGLEKGTVDNRKIEGWSAHVWAVRSETVFEAKYSMQGCYHGYLAPQMGELLLT